MAVDGKRAALGGVLVVDKPTDWTSRDVCPKLRGVFGQKRVGHGGTLDPMATGVLPVFLGRATRAVEFVTEGEKEYIAALQLGVTTDTQDTTGNVLAERPVSVTGEELTAALSRFTGEIEQIPPMYSAIKMGGKKLYELARKGVEVERKPRRVTISQLELLGWPDAGEDFTLRVVCSKGTYVRTLCHDIGEALGCGGCMSALKRTRVGTFRIEEAVTVDMLVSADDPWQFVRPVEDCFPQPSVTIRDAALKRARNGNPFPLQRPAGEYKIFDENGDFLLLGRCDGRECRIVKSFYEV